MALSVALSACGTDSPPPLQEDAPDQLEGVVTDIQSEGLDYVTSFKLRSEGETYEIFIDPDIDYGFRLGHLQAHLVGADPVIVELEERAGKLYATSIIDA